MRSRTAAIRLVLAALVAGATVPVVVFAVRVIASSWMVFPPPRLNPLPPTSDLSVLAAASRYAPEEATYPFFVAQVRQEQLRQGWFDAEAAGEGREAAVKAERAVQLVPTNPYYHRLAGSIALDRAAHPSSSPEEIGQLAESAVHSMQQAMIHSPSSPLLHQQVGLELLRAWEIVGPEGRGQARAALSRAAALDPTFLRPTLENLWARIGDSSRLAEVDAVTSADAAARLTLAGFLEERARVQLLVDPVRGDELRDRALLEYQRAVESSDLDADLVEQWAAAYRRLAPDDAAAFIAATRQLVGLHADRTEAWLAVANAEAMAGHADEESEALARAVEASADRSAAVRARALSRRSDSLFAGGRYELALEGYRELVAIGAGDFRILILAARCLDALGRPAEALVDYETAVRAAPRSSSARETLARAYLERNEYLAAIRQWQTIVAREPEGVAARVSIARAYVALGLLDQAMRYYSEALDRSPDNASLRSEIDGVVGRLRVPGR